MDREKAPQNLQDLVSDGYLRVVPTDPITGRNDTWITVPEEPGRKPYQLLMKTMEETKRAAIAKVAMHQREYTVIVRPRANGLTLHTMYYANEIRQVAEYGQTAGILVKPEEIKLAKQLVESLVADFEPQKYHDEYQERLKALLDAKLKGQEVTTAPQPQLAPVIDMMEALKKSLAAREAVPKKPPARAVEAVGGEETAEVEEKKVRKRVSR